MIAEVTAFESEISLEEKIRIRSEVRNLSVLNPLKSYTYLLLDWVIIISTIYLAVKIANPLFSIFTLFVIGARQHALLLIMHDAAHSRLTNNKTINLLTSDLLCAFLAFVTTTKYKDTHLAHHKFLNTELDPDLQLRAGKKEWQFPQKKHEIIYLLLRQLLGLNSAQLLGKIYRFGVTNTTASKRTEMPLLYKLLRIIFYLIIIALLIWFQIWPVFLLYWILPAFTVVPLIFRIRSIAEHFGLAWSHELNSARNVELNFLESFFIVPHSGNYHLDHHLYPSVPFYNLKKLHAVLLQNPVYAAKAVNSKGYLLANKNSVLKSIVA